MIFSLKLSRILKLWTVKIFLHIYFKTMPKRKSKQFKVCFPGQLLESLVVVKLIKTGSNVIQVSRKCYAATVDDFFGHFPLKMMPIILFWCSRTFSDWPTYTSRCDLRSSNRFSMHFHQFHYRKKILCQYKMLHFTLKQL